MINLDVFIALKSFPGGSESKECATMQEIQVQSLG